LIRLKATPFAHRLSLTTALLVAFALSITGCEMFSFISQAFDTETKAIYEIENRETAVLVEDPINYLGDPRLKGVIASNIAFDLTEGDAVDKKKMIPAEAVAAQEKLLGKDFAKLPLDELGRKIGAKQVIHVYIEAASLNLEGGVMKPALQARVRLVDAITGKRLFPRPEDSAQQDAATVERGFGVAISMPVRISPDNSPGDASRAMEFLAIRTGKRIGWIFREHRERQPGEGFDEKP